MSKILSVGSPAFAFMTKIAVLVWLNLLWFVGCIPVFTIGVSTAALYQSIFAYQKGKDEAIHKLFWNAYKNNFKKGIVLLLIVLAVGGVLVADAIILYVTGILNTIAAILLGIPVVLVILAAGYIFPLQAFFENTIRHTVKNAWLLSCRHLIVSAVVGVINVLPLVMMLVIPETFLKISILWVMIGTAATAYVNAFLLNKVFSLYIPKDTTGKANQETAQEDGHDGTQQL